MNQGLRHAALILATGGAALLAACSTPPIVGHHAVRTVDIGGVSVWVTRYDDGTWAATRFAAMPSIPPPNPSSETALLVRAIEKASSCKAESPYFHIQSTNLYTTVRCQ